MFTRPLALAALALAACTDAPDPGAATVTGEVTVVLPGVPVGINCIELAFRDQHDVTEHRHASLPPRFLSVDGLHLGAYEVTARAYASSDCAVVPAGAPWGTAEPTVFILTPTSSNFLQLSLVPTRPVDIFARFVETEIVVAQDQGPLAGIAAAGNHIAWTVAETTAPGRIVSLFDDLDATLLPVVVNGAATRPGDLAVTADGRIFWVQNALRGQPTAGAIWRHTPFVGTELLAGGQSSAEITYAADTDAVYWTDFSRVQVVNGSGPPGPFVLSDEPGANNITVLRGSRPDYEILWGRYDDGLVRRYPKFQPVHTAATSGLLPPTAGIIGIAADDAAAYVTTWDETAGGQGAIYRVATDGSNDVLALTPLGPGKWPVEVLGGWVYYAGGGELRRVPADGSGPEELLASGAIASFALTSWGGSDFIYWLDNRFGGVVWRGRLQ
jgi:hypothetical protein